MRNKTMKTTKEILTFFIITLLIMSCKSDTKVKFPILTSVGDLVSVEIKGDVKTEGEYRAIKPDEYLYLLTFKGKSEFILNGSIDKSDPHRLLVDQDGTEYWPIYSGSLNEDGIISDNDWMISGNMTVSENGEWVYSGTLTIPKPEFILIYYIPKNIKELSLRDGTVQIPIK
jgi:hypothetical protein